MMYQSSPIKDDVLKSYIEQIFTRYDTNTTGALNPNEMTSFFNDLFRSLNIPLALSAQQSLEAIKAVYPAYNGTVNRDELFAAFKVLLGIAPMPQQTPVATTFQNYPGMVQNGGYVGMPNFVNVGNGFVPQQGYMVNPNLIRQTPQNYPTGYVQGFNGFQNQGNQQQQFNNNFRRQQ